MRPCSSVRPTAAREDGIAMIVTLMVLLLVSALMVGFVTAIVADQRASGLDRDQTQAYAAAHAGLEQLTADLSGLFATDFSPTATQINSLTATPPNLTNFTFVEPGGGSGYRINFTADAQGNPSPEATTGTTISAGPYQGLRGIITPYNITVTARTAGGAEVRMRRTLQTVAMPVFQFGQFSDADLGFHSEQDFEFGGRVHTNGTLYLAQGGNTSSRLSLPDRITAVNEVIRTHLMNGYDGSTDYRGTVRVIKNPPNNFRNLARDEGSLVSNDFAILNEPRWTSLSVGTYASNIRNGRTGARRLDLPLVSQNAAAIDLIRRPAQNSAEDTANPVVFNQRLFAQASIRILLSDTATAITSLPTVTAMPAPIRLNATAAGYAPGGTAAPFALSGGASPYRSPVDTPLIDGYLKIEQRTAAGWQDITLQILNFGIAGRNLSTGLGVLNAPATSTQFCPEPNPNAIIRVQRIKDVPTSPLVGACGVTVVAGVVIAVSPSATDYWPNTLYDTREGNVRDNMPSSGAGSMNATLGGVIQYIELDVNNLKRWIEGNAAYPGGTGPQTRNENGYIVYFSDRRLNRNAATNNETGEYGFEDFLNPGSSTGARNNTLDVGEDVNGNNTLEVYGEMPVDNTGFTAPFDGGARPEIPFDVTGANAAVPRANRQVFFRRALKVVNGGLNQIPSPGLTIAAENPVYVQGNFNATAASTTAEPNMACAIIADAVTLLSNSWNDIRSFLYPNNASSRTATPTATGYRMAVIAGKSVPFPRPTAWSSQRDFGTDGGTHDFLRYLETWDNGMLQYNGSLVSFYRSRQAVGTYKSGVSLSATNRNVFSVGTRVFTFDTDFLDTTLLPPGTPSFRDVNTLTFRQLLRPTQ
jgi:PilX N-terminal